MSDLDQRSHRLLIRLVDQPALVARLPETLDWLSDSEQARWQAFGTEARRLTFLAGRWLARQTVAEWLGSSGPLDGPTLQVASSGACEVADLASVFVSISHHGTQVACAVAAVPVGVDIEGPRARRDVVALAGTVHGGAHQAALARMSPPERDASFLQAWTLKEAWLKARQLGLDFALMRSLQFDPADAADDTGDVGEAGKGDEAGDGGNVHTAAAAQSRPDTAVTRHGDVFIALAAVPALPSVIDGPSGWIWHHHRSRRSAPRP